MQPFVFEKAFPVKNGRAWLALWELPWLLRQQLHCWRAAVQLPPELAVHHATR